MKELGPLVPVKPGSKGPPLIDDWPNASPDKLQQILQANPQANIALRLDDYLVIDPDSEEAVSYVNRVKSEGKLPLTVTYRTWRGYEKFIYLCPEEITEPVKIKENGFKLELRTGNGQYDIIPPSTVNDGTYQWVDNLGPQDVPVAQIPAETLKEILSLAKKDGEGQAVKKNDKWLDLLQGAAEGERNDTAAKLAGHFLGKGLCPGEVETILLDWNRKNNPPLPEKEIVQVVKSISKAEAKKQPTGLVWPDSVMAGAAGNFAKAYVEYLETPAQFLYISYLTILGHLVSEKISLLSESGAQPRLYAVLLGESADVRKSTAMKVTIKFFEGTIIDLDAVNVSYGVGSGEGLARAFNPIEKLDGDMPPKSRIVLNFDELKSFVQKCKIDSSIPLTIVTSLFEDNHYASLTKNRRIELYNVHLSILAASTLDTYQSMFTSSFLDIGFLNRLFIVIGEGKRKFSIPEPIPNDLKKELSFELGKILSFTESLSHGRGYPMPLTPGARKIFDDWYHNQEYSVFTKRLDTYGHRLMPLLAINEMKSEVDEDIARKVVALLDYQLAARKLADPLDADNAVAKMEQNIRRRLGVSRMRGRDLKKACHYERAGIWIFNQALQNLTTAKEVEFDKKSKFYQVVNHG